MRWNYIKNTALLPALLLVTWVSGCAFNKPGPVRELADVVFNITEGGVAVGKDKITIRTRKDFGKDVLVTFLRGDCLTTWNILLTPSWAARRVEFTAAGSPEPVIVDGTSLKGATWRGVSGSSPALAVTWLRNLMLEVNEEASVPLVAIDPGDRKPVIVTSTVRRLPDRDRNMIYQITSDSGVQTLLETDHRDLPTGWTQGGLRATRIPDEQ